MHRLRELHRTAMHYADLAFEAKFNGETELFEANSLEAYNFEVQATELVKNDLTAEPTRSVLFRSAATLAIDCKKYDEARRLIEIGLGGEPPEEIVNELRDLQEQIAFYRHLDLRGKTLSKNEIQFNLAGKSIGEGSSPIEVFLTRLNSFQKIFYRTLERKMGKPFVEKTNFIELSRSFNILLSVPHTGSYSVLLKFVHPQQPSLPGFEKDLPPVQDVIQEVFECVKLVNNAEEEELKSRLNNDAYYRNFIGLSRVLAPDGTDVTSVGLTCNNQTYSSEVSLVRRKSDFYVKPPLKNGAESQIVKVTGDLTYADKQSYSQGRIRIVSENGKRTTVIVPEGIMSDIVKPLWESRVEVTGFIVNNDVIELINITEATDESNGNENIKLPKKLSGGVQTKWTP